MKTNKYHFYILPKECNYEIKYIKLKTNGDWEHGVFMMQSLFEVDANKSDAEFLKKALQSVVNLIKYHQ